MTVNHCGPCTACCTLVPVAELDKRSFTRCARLQPAAATSPGCRIYGARPESCRRWSCQWLTEGWDEDLRPERCGVIFDPIADLVWINGAELPVVQAWVMPGTKLERLREPPIAAVIAAAAAGGHAVLFRLGPKLTFVVWRQNGQFFASEPKPPSDRLGNETERLQRALRLSARVQDAHR